MANISTNKVKSVSTISRHSLYFFALAGILFVPFPFHLFPWQEELSQFLFQDLATFLAKDVFGLMVTSPRISSDSATLYILVGFLFSLSLVMSLIFYFAKKNLPEKFFTLSGKIIALYLSLLLFKYGFDKIFKAQFYLPEPNILYTPFGQLDRDILYWSTMGTSYSYSLFSGILEVLGATLLLFQHTRTLGLVLVAGILLHVMAINFSFDISVKVYSCFLFFLTILLLYPSLKPILNFFTSGESGQLQIETPLFIERKKLRIALKSLVIGLILGESLYPYIKSGNFNDDLTERPFLHGAYEFIHEEKIDAYSLTIPFEYKRFFIHRDGYLIFQTTGEKMIDYKLEIDRNNQLLRLTDYTDNPVEIGFVYYEADSLLRLNMGGAFIDAKTIDWRKMPALGDQFHWTIDQVD